jgi:hypothetical protein
MRSEADEVRSVGWRYYYKRKYERLSRQRLSLGAANGRSMVGEWSVMVGACRTSIWYMTLCRFTIHCTGYPKRENCEKKRDIKGIR